MNYMDYIQDVSIFLVTENKDIVSPEDYDIYNGDEVIFVMLTNDMLNAEYHQDNTINISLKYLDKTNTEDQVQEIYKMRDKEYGFIEPNSWTEQRYIFQADKQQIPNADYQIDKAAIYDLDGYNHTQNIIRNSYDILKKHNNKAHYQTIYGELGNKHVEMMFPAIFVAYHSFVDFDNRKIQGYLPSIGQLVFLRDNENKINKAIRPIIGVDIMGFDRKLNMQHTYGLWSSSEYNIHYVIALKNGRMEPLDRVGDKCNVMPLFHFNL